MLLTRPSRYGALPALAAAVLLLPGCGSPRLNFSVSFDRPGIKEAKVIDGPSDAKVAMIDVRGTLADAKSSTLLGEGDNPVDRFAAELDRASKDHNVKALLVRINSPGGTVAASDTMYRELRRFADTTKKPVVASLGEVAASGGYYLALAADRVVAEPSTITGSIGVIFPTLNVADGLNRLGIRSRAITSGANKDLANPLEPPREQHYAIIKGTVDEFYGQFKGLVVARRPSLKPEDVPGATDGRVFTGAHAVAIGLADETGGVREAFETAKGLAGLKKARLVKYVGSGEAAQSIYAHASPPGARHASNQPTQLNLIQLNLAGAVLDDRARSGFYYLWAPELPLEGP